MKIEFPNKPVIFLMGPTASGKTACAIDLVQSGNFEIISVDSAMIYQQMNIGSAKPNDKELLLAPHHLIDFIDPTQAYSAANFRNDAIELINQIHLRGNTPLLTGGTMLYFKALREGLADLPQSTPETRQQVKQLVEKVGINQLHHLLAEIDPVTANRLHDNDRQRIGRAYEVYLQSKKPLSQWHAEQKLTALPNPLLSIALAPEDRSVLHQRIAKRFEIMIEQGFLDEVSQLFSRGDLSLDNTSMKSVGYRQIWQYLAGEMTLAEAKERAIIATRQLAKRQYTWLRSWPNVEWYDPLDVTQLNLAKQRIIQFVGQH